MDPERFLSECPSPAHRAVAGALRLALTGDLAHGVVDDCARTDAMAFAEIAQAHYIDTALAPAFAEGSPLADAFPDDLVLFFAEMAAANGRRNSALSAQLTEIGAAFAAEGIACVALKGATELLDPWWADPRARYLSDLDLLVRQTDLALAGKVLGDLGAIQGAGETPVDHHHVKPYLAPGWEAMVELHVQTGASPIADLLPTIEVFLSARQSGTPGILLPCPVHRIVHLVAHAPKGGAGSRLERLYLREIAGLQAGLTRLDPGERSEAAALFEAEALGGLWRRYVAVTAAILAEDYPRPQQRDARRALATFGRPGDARWRDTLAWAWYYLRVLIAEPAKRRYYVQRLRRPGGVRALWHFHRQRNRLIR